MTPHGSARQSSAVSLAGAPQLSFGGGWGEYQARLALKCARWNRHLSYSKIRSLSLSCGFSGVAHVSLLGRRLAFRALFA